MSRKLRLTESELYNVIKKIIKETEDEYYRISPEDYLDMMQYASYNGNVFRKMKKYGGKPLYITGDLDLSGLPVKDIGPIGYVDGRFDISRRYPNYFSTIAALRNQLPSFSLSSAQ